MVRTIDIASSVVRLLLINVPMNLALSQKDVLLSINPMPPFVLNVDIPPFLIKRGLFHHIPSRIGTCILLRTMYLYSGKVKMPIKRKRGPYGLGPHYFFSILVPVT
jgi:hypothetical protein